MKRDKYKKVISLSLAALIAVTSSPEALLSFAEETVITEEKKNEELTNTLNILDSATLEDISSINLKTNTSILEDKIKEIQIKMTTVNENTAVVIDLNDQTNVELVKVDDLTWTIKAISPGLVTLTVNLMNLDDASILAYDSIEILVEEVLVEEVVAEEEVVVEEEVLAEVLVAEINNNTYENNTIIINDSFESGLLNEQIVKLESNNENITGLVIKSGIVSVNDLNWIKTNLSNLKDFKIINEARVHSLDEPTITTSDNILVDEAFDGLSSLETVEIIGLIKIGANAFEGCNSFKTLFLGSSVPTASVNSFEAIKDLDAEIVIPNGSFMDYRETNDDVSLEDNKWFYFNIHELSNDARLTNIIINENEMLPSFNSSITDYSVNVAYNVTNISITPVMKDNTGTIAINNEAVSTYVKKVFQINEGSNTFVIITTSEDKSETVTTNVTITRGSENDNIIQTVAGSDFIGDGSVSIKAILNSPTEMIYHGSDLIFSDLEHNRIRKIDNSGIITTLVGSGVEGYAGDGGNATNASLNGPSGLVMYNDELYFADTNNNVIRKIGKDGIISTIAGTGLVSSVTDDVLAVNSSLNKPTGVAFDKNGNLYITDGGNKRIRKVDKYGLITSVAGVDETLDRPYGITINKDEVIFFTDQGSGKVYRIDDLDSNPNVREYGDFYLRVLL